MSDDRDKQIPGFTQDELNQFAAIAARSSLGYGRRVPEKDVKAQIEKDKKNMRASEEYRENERILNEEVGPGKRYASPQDFFDTMIETLDDYGPRNMFEREAAELFLSDHGIEYTEEKKDERGPEKPALDTMPPMPAPEPAESESNKIWREWLVEAEDWTPDKEKKIIQEHYPNGLVVRGADVKWNEKKQEVRTAKRSNLDGEACLFFFKKLIGLDEAYLEKTRYVAPGSYSVGSLNLDTSWGLYGGAGTLDHPVNVEAYDHHSPDAPRSTSAFQLLYDLTFGFDDKDDTVYKNRTDKVMANPEERIVWENLAMFVTAVDSLTLPKAVSWEDIWDNFENNIFAICVAHQGKMASRVDKLFEFFKSYSWEDAFRPLDKREITNVLGTVTVKKNQETKEERVVFLSDLQAENKQKAEKFFNTGHGHTLFSPTYGRILVAFNEQVPGGKLAAFGHGYDALLLWKPEENSFTLNVRPEKTPIPHALHEKLGKDQTVWVRGGMLFQPDWRSKAQGLKKLSFSFTELIKELGIDEKTLSASFKRKIEEAEECWKK